MRDEHVRRYAELVELRDFQSRQHVAIESKRDDRRGHRLEAAKRLGWTHIDCIEVDDDPISAEMWEIAENLHRLDLTKEQRDEHIRRYAELLERRAAEIPVVQNEPVEIGYGKPPARPKGLARQIAEETGLSKSTVQRALNPQPPMIKAAVEPESEHDAIIREANAIVSAWNRARQVVGSYPLALRIYCFGILGRSV
jgi:ParB-like chromosome segregation protein Spo0J